MYFRPNLGADGTLVTFNEVLFAFNLTGLKGLRCNGLLTSNKTITCLIHPSCLGLDTRKDPSQLGLHHIHNSGQNRLDIHHSALELIHVPPTCRPLARTYQAYPTILPPSPPYGEAPFQILITSVDFFRLPRPPTTAAGDGSRPYSQGLIGATETPCSELGLMMPRPISHSKRCLVNATTLA